MRPHLWPRSTAGGATSTQVKIESRQSEPRRQSRGKGWRRVETKDAATLFAMEMHVHRMLSGRCGRKPVDPVVIRTFVCQPALDQPIEDTIEGHAVERRLAQRQFNLVMG